MYPDAGPLDYCPPAFGTIGLIGRLMVKINDFNGLQVSSPSHPCTCMSSTGTCIATWRSRRGFSICSSASPECFLQQGWSVSKLLTACHQVELSGPVATSVLLQGALEAQTERHTRLMQAQNPHTGVRINFSVHSSAGVHGQRMSRAECARVQTALVLSGPRGVNSLRLPQRSC